MDRYYVNDNAQNNGGHEVHKESCRYLPTIQSKTYLGRLSNCQEAIIEAEKLYLNVYVCAFCCEEFHTR